MIANEERRSVNKERAYIIYTSIKKIKIPLKKEKPRQNQGLLYFIAMKTKS